MDDDVLFSTPEMSATFSRKAHVQHMLLFEAALARAEARAGIIPAEAARHIGASCRVEFFDVAALYREAAIAGTPAIPLVRMLTAHVEGEAKKFVHWGATSQDVIDTALMLQMREGLDQLIATLHALGASCARLSDQHRYTLMVGRTLLQQALPITFGLKTARWLAMVTRLLHELCERRDHALAVQFGGAAGTLASLGDAGLRVAGRLGEELHLPVPELPWHTERDRVAGIATTLGIVAGAMAKIGGDIALLAQTEVGEASEGAIAGKGSSSAMPQKRNPVDTTNALAAARLATGMVPIVLTAMAQEHERAVGGWQAEWVAIPDLFRFTAGAVAGIHNALAGLQVDAAHMRANLDLTHGLVMAESLTMALAPHVGKSEAYHLVQAVCNQVMEAKGDLHQAVKANAQICAILSLQEIDMALDPAAYLGSTDAFIEQVLTIWAGQE